MDWNNYDHSGHLLLLERNGYAKHDSIHCPACASRPGCGTFAFRMPSVNTPFQLNAMGRTPLAADANPVILRIRMGHKANIPPSTSPCSMNHQQRGQNVLFTDLSIVWLASPHINGDNIYLPNGVKDSESIPLAPHATLNNDIFLAQ